MHLWTDTPISELWNQIRVFRSAANVNQLLTGKLKAQRPYAFPNNEATQQRSQFIAACIRQADDYHVAEQEVTLTTRPLLQYYGAQALAKAVVLVLDQNIGMDVLHYHGLKQNSLASVPGASTILQAAAAVGDGIFPNFCMVVEGKRPANNAVLRFRELARITPDLKEIYERLTGELSHTFYLSGRPSITGDGYFEVYFSHRVTCNAVASVFPEFSEDFSPTQDPGNPGFRSRSILSEQPSFFVMEKGTVAGQYLIRAHSSGIYRSPLVLHAGLFVLSLLVRYQPDLWARAIEGDKDGSAAIVEAFCNLARRRFPHDILSLLWGEPIVLATPAYLT